MELYKEVHLPFADILKKYTAEYMAESTPDLLDAQIIPIPINERDEINSYLKSKGVSNLGNILAFKRKMPYAGYLDCHIDMSNKSTVMNCSIVIPVSGCRHTKQYWYSGDHTIEHKVTPSGAKYCTVVWNGLPQFAGDVEIYDHPTLVRTNVPHSAYSLGEEYRTTCTIRFNDNESFEYLSEHLSK